MGTFLLAHEVGFAVESEGFPNPFEDALSLLNAKMEQIMHGARCDDAIVFLSDDANFRYQVATSRPYKEQRKEAKRPYHLENIKSYMQHGSQWPCHIASGVEADDNIAMHATALGTVCVVCSRDKDLRQLDSAFYGWEVGNQPERSIPPSSGVGILWMDSGKLQGKGYLWFCAQWLSGDTADNIPGLPRCGPARSFNLLKDCTTPEEAEEIVLDEYQRKGYDEAYSTEQAQLVWLCRRWEDGGQEPELWRPGLYG